MKVNKNILLGAGGAVVLVLLVMAGFLLSRGISQLSETRKKLEDSKRQLEAFYRKDPFPSNENVGREKENVQVLDEWFGELTAALGEGQIESTERSPSIFMRLLEKKKGELLKRARQNRTFLPENFGFGFDRYFATGSALPVPDDVPRLTQQLLIVEKLCDVLFEQKVEEIMAISRDEFEDIPASAGLPARPRHRPSARTRGRRADKNVGIMGEDDLYAKLHFVFEFKTKESHVWNTLNRLASHEMFIVITGVKFDKGAPDVAVPEPKGLEKIEDILYRDERLVCGWELEAPMRVKLELDVYRFRGE